MVLLSRPARVMVAATVGYGLGTVLFADVATRMVRRRQPQDTEVHATASGNPGAANAMAQLGKRWGALVLAGDMGKGAAAAQIGRAIGGDAGAYAAATAAVAGHCFPPFRGFRGGKGVATSAGTTWVVFPIYAPVDVGLAALSFLVSRHAAKATLFASTAFVGSAILWNRRRWPGLWGARPSVGLPLYAAATTAMIALRFANWPPPPRQAAAEPAEAARAA